MHQIFHSSLTSSGACIKILVRTLNFSCQHQIFHACITFSGANIKILMCALKCFLQTYDFILNSFDCIWLSPVLDLILLLCAFECPHKNASCKQKFFGERVMLVMERNLVSDSNVSKHLGFFRENKKARITSGLFRIFFSRNILGKWRKEGKRSLCRFGICFEAAFVDLRKSPFSPLFFFLKRRAS